MSNRGRNNKNNAQRACPNCFDPLDAAARNCQRCTGENYISNRQRRNARRAAAYRNQQAAVLNVNAQRPIPVVVDQQMPKSDFRLPGNQVWVKKPAAEWGSKAADANDAIMLKTILDGIPEIKEDSRIYRVMIGFVAMSSGTFGLVEGINSDRIPDPPIIGRLGIKKNTYQGRNFSFGGKTPAQLADKGFVWCLDEHKRDAKRVQLTDYWIAISRPAPLMPPEDFLVCDPV